MELKGTSNKISQEVGTGSGVDVWYVKLELRRERKAYGGGVAGYSCIQLGHIRISKRFESACESEAPFFISLIRSGSFNLDAQPITRVSL
jgi:hypothetical protein